MNRLVPRPSRIRVNADSDLVAQPVAGRRKVAEILSPAARFAGLEAKNADTLFLDRASGFIDHLFAGLLHAHRPLEWHIRLSQHAK